MEELNNISFCAKRKDMNNIELFVKLIPSKETNKINMACINILFSNEETVRAFLNLQEERIIKIAKAIPSQLKTLLCLDNFNMIVEKVLKSNPSSKKQVEILKSLDYSSMSSYINSIELVPALNNESLKQMTFNF